MIDRFLLGYCYQPFNSQTYRNLIVFYLQNIPNTRTVNISRVNSEVILYCFPIHGKVPLINQYCTLYRYTECIMHNYGQDIF